jgi:hypothetical protein
MNMRFDRIGPLGLWNRFDERWIATRQACLLFFVASLFVIALTPVFFGFVEPSTSGVANVFWGVVGVVGAFSIFFLWIGMWRYWARVDASAKSAKRFWFLVMLAGFWYGSCLYCWCLYLPRVMHLYTTGSTAPRSTEPRQRKSTFGKLLLICWLCFLLFVALIFGFPKPLATTIPVVHLVSVLLVLTSFAYVILWIYREGISRN